MKIEELERRWGRVHAWGRVLLRSAFLLVLLGVLTGFVCLRDTLALRGPAGGTAPAAGGFDLRATPAARSARGVAVPLVPPRDRIAARTTSPAASRRGYGHLYRPPRPTGPAVPQPPPPGRQALPPRRVGWKRLLDTPAPAQPKTGQPARSKAAPAETAASSSPPATSPETTSAAGSAAATTEAAATPPRMDWSRKAIVGPVPRANIVVYAGHGTILLRSHADVVRTYRDVQAPPDTSAPKQSRGDRRSPRGLYYVRRRLDARLQPVLDLSYPSPTDAKTALESGLIEKDAYERILKAHEKKAPPPTDTPLGGPVRIVGADALLHDADGAFVLPPDAMGELWLAAPLGTPVQIVP